MTTFQELIKKDEINSQSGLDGWWICPNGHSFKQKVSKRFLRGDGCTECSKTGISRIQILIEHELRYIFPDLEDNKTVNKYRIDFFIPSLELVIEYDGKHVHIQKKDLIKNRALKKEGFKIIRVRESPLKKQQSWILFIKLHKNLKI